MIGALLAALLLPPLGLIFVTLLGLLLAWRGWRPGLALAALACAGQLLLATPMAVGLLTASLEDDIAALLQRGDPVTPGAIVILGGDGVSTRDGADIGPLTLQRLRAGAALQRRTGLPVLLTSGPVPPQREPLAQLMALSLQADFGITARWIEPAARDTWENAAFSLAMLHAEGIDTVYVVTHGWHMPRALYAFARHGGVAVPAPVRLFGLPAGSLPDWLPRADRLARSWYAIHEWVGLLVYTLRRD